MKFTARQLEAIDVAQLGRDACVVAGPGSGKTAVLVERYFRLIESGIPPHRILAITFTEKAAANIRTRLARKLGGHMDRAYVSTVHAFCFRLIRENAVLAGVDPASSILDEREAALLQTRSLSDVLDEVFEKDRAAATLLMRSLSDADLVGNIPAVFDAMRGTGRGYDAPPNGGGPSCEEIDARMQEAIADSRSGLTPLQKTQISKLISWNRDFQIFRGKGHSLEMYRAAGEFQCNLQHVRRGSVSAAILRKLRDETLPALRAAILTSLFEPKRKTLLHILDRFETVYASRKRERIALDYSDLESFAIHLLEEHEEVRARMRRQFQQVMIDEFQDTNGQQSRLLDLLRGPETFYAVGDINQSIFSFRHSSPEIFRAYRDQVLGSAKHHVELVENWRSRPEILLAVETILHGAAGIEPRPLEAARELPEKRRPSVEVAIVKDTAEGSSLEIESKWVARKILELRGNLKIGESGKLAGYGDMAVLFRSFTDVNVFADVFDRHGIEYLLNRKKGFFDLREVADLTHLLRAISNPRDEISTAAVLRSPFVAVSDEALLHLKQIDKNLGGALSRLKHQPAPGLDPLDLAKLRHFEEHLGKWRAAQPYAALDRTLLRAMDDCGYEWEPGTRAGANIEKFLALARDSRVPLAQFVEDLELMRESDARELGAPFDDNVTAVRIMTVHSAKGLEFPIVFLPALHKGVDSRAQPLSFTQELGLGVCWKDPVNGESQGDSIHLANLEAIKAREREEADRLLYVALTRAEEHLVLSYGIPERRSKNWAEAVARVFDPGGRKPDGIEAAVEIRAPRGRIFSANVVCANTAPDGMGFAFANNQPAVSAVAPRPELTEGHDGNISVTSLAIYADCPRRYYLARYLGWEPPDTAGAKHVARGIPASEVGSQVHNLLAGIPVNSPDLEACRLADTFDQGKLGRQARRATRCEREFAFLLAIDDVVLSGKIDLWFEESGELILVDYKTDEVAPSEAPVRAETYALQLRYYALALERVTGRLPDRAYVHLLRPDVLLEIGLDASSLDAAKRLVHDVAEAQSTMRFPLHEAERCRQCPFHRNLCPAK
ncbi:MAG: UvrD-helicase domain-containing protein [Bryobacteraceae bacterium]